MHTPSIKTRRDMEAAAELRAAGATWDGAGEFLGRWPFVLLRWSRIYREYWERLLRCAEEWNVQQSATLRVGLRSLLRHEKTRVRRATANCLLRRRLAEKAAEFADPSDWLAHVHEMSDERLDECLNALMEGFGKRPPGSAPEIASLSESVSAQGTQP